MRGSCERQRHEFDALVVCENVHVGSRVTAYRIAQDALLVEAQIEDGVVVYTGRDLARGEQTLCTD
jgi:hypothetical protein